MHSQHFVNTLSSNRAKAYLVGGAVRDMLMGEVPKDRDYCVTGISQELFESLFPSAKLQGKDFPVYRMAIDGEISEVALARKERKVSSGHTGFRIQTSPEIKIEDDLARRDITINSMAIDLETNELIDPFHGEIDLQNKMIRATTQAFTEDPLRVYRAARFAARYGFFIEYGTLMMMNKLKSELPSLSIERVTEEMKKALLTDNPSLFFYALKTAGVLDVHFPEINCLSEFDQNPEYHPEGNVFEHTMQVLEAARYLLRLWPVTSEVNVMLSALLHDVGKAVTKGTNPKKGTVTYIGHEFAGVEIADKFLEKFNLHSNKKAVLFGVQKHMIFHEAFTKMKPGKAVDFIEGKFELVNGCSVRKPGVKTNLQIYDYITLCFADIIGRLSSIKHIPDAISVMIQIVAAYDTANNIELDKIISLLKNHLPTAENAKRMAKDFLTAAKHKWIMENYQNQTLFVTCSLNVDELKQKYNGEKLGHIIHSDKRKQRTACMREVRESAVKQVNITSQ
ncbi:HD domain-containing protein [Bacillus velezensis]|uniref:HD domain-containing protein n=1 Tax=Bacillus velezensis TaxID=492670 RepID=UPI001A920C4B|nr:HD domain-containing protein [Bacillus velezensis]BCT30324.1 multifunctional CCA protein [Bacillus velezensis]